MALPFPLSGRIMLPGTATECFAFSEQKPAPPNTKSFGINKGRASHRLHQIKSRVFRYMTGSSFPRTSCVPFVSSEAIAALPMMTIGSRSQLRRTSASTCSWRSRTHGE